jgi:hypothetical protein
VIRTLSASFPRRVGGAAPRKTARQPNKFGAIASPDASPPGHQQYAVRRDGSGSVAHDDRMVLPDEEDRLIGQAVVGLLTDQVASGTRIDFPPSDSQFCCAAMESSGSTVSSVRSANSSLVVDTS